MKKLLIAFGMLAAISMMSCTSEVKQDVQPVEEQTDSIEQPAVQEVTGVAVDGAMNSVYLKIGEDTVEYISAALFSKHG